MPEGGEVDPQRLVADLAKLSPDWHGHGLLSQKATSAIARNANRPTLHSMETGAGRSTILLSNLSADHTVFTIANDSLQAALDSPLTRRERIHVVPGPTQLTLPGHEFAAPLDLALLDGPHGYPFPDLEYFFVYPHLATGALLVIDDIHIPTINNMFRFLSEDAMFEVVEVVDTTGFLRRTDAPVFPAHEDGWWTQSYNYSRFPISGWPAWGGLRPRVRNLVPRPVRQIAKRAVPSRIRLWFRT